MEAGDMWRYFAATSEPNPDWFLPAFDDRVWLEGPGGIGYGDYDDRTLIDPVPSLFLRRTFFISDPAIILQVVLNMDYDDAFVAYLNGVEIARANIGVVGDHPRYDEYAYQPREALMYQGGQPDYFVLEHLEALSLIAAGENVLAIQVHNQSANSSDMSAIPFLSIGVSATAQQYRPTPEWFVEPLHFASSNLPIISINTNGQIIKDDERIVAHMDIKYNADSRRNTLEQQSIFAGRVNIEIRGSSTATFPKKSYGFETQDAKGENLNVSLLGLPKENDWILYGPYSDKSLLRNSIAFYVARAMGPYASRMKYCEVLINDEYAGLYILMEKIKRDKNRVAINKLKATEIDGDEITGGYIIKVDKKEGEYRGWTSLAQGSSIFFQYVYPDRDIIVPEQENYIQLYMAEFETALAGPSFRDPEKGYAPFVDLLSFVDTFIINEFTKDIDGYRFSTFMYKDKNGPLTMGPVWDYNLGFANVDYGNEGAMDIDGWIYDKGGARMWWWQRLMRDTAFKNRLGLRWHELRRDPMNTQNLFATIDSLVAYIDEAQDRNFQRWPTLGLYVWPNWFVGDTFAEEIEFLKTWIADRLDWMDDNMPSDETQVELMERLNDFAALYPNPFNQSTVISCNLDKPSHLNITIYDLNGRVITTLIDELAHAGHHAVVWDASSHAAGAYFIKITAGDDVQIKKCLMLK
ncbi:CotH kinase family protein [candidate division KSB1 bacterium]|nr:CotH kinase family protein [candidate division KSB1 bacterium]